jgi:heptosyltransferase III
VKRILVIRGGAIGDFILTLPALKLLRENFADAHIEILGYKHVIALAHNRYYANTTRSIDYALLARFFARAAELPSELIEYFGSFDLIVSYLFDPDQIFAENVKRCGASRLVVGSPKFNDREHASLQLARPLQQLGLRLQDSSAWIFPNEEDRRAAADFLQGSVSPVVAIHPGSGSEKKNWPLENWIALGTKLLNDSFPVSESPRSLIVISGEADEERTTQLRSHWRDNPAVRFASNLPLPHLAAILQDALFFGHDSGVSHLAAAAGARCILLFGPTDPLVWAPTNKNVRIVRAPDGDLHKLAVAEVFTACGHPREARDLAN